MSTPPPEAPISARDFDVLRRWQLARTVYDLVASSPSEWCLRSNSRLYGRSGLERTRAALVPGGVLVVWSAFANPGFVRQLEKSGFSASALSILGRGRRGPRQTIFLGRTPG